MKIKYRNRKQPTKKKARKNKTLKHKKSRKTRRLKRRSSKRRGGEKPSTAEDLMKGLEELAGEESLHPYFIRTAYQSFIKNPTAIENVEREDKLYEVTTYILDKFRQFSSNPNLINIMKAENYDLIDKLETDEFIDVQYNDYDYFVTRLFVIAPVGDHLTT